MINVNEIEIGSLYKLVGNHLSFVNGQKVKVEKKINRKNIMLTKGATNIIVDVESYGKLWHLQNVK